MWTQDFHQVNHFFLQVIRGKSSPGILKQAKPASKSEVAKGPKRATVEKPHDYEGLCESLCGRLFDGNAYSGKAANLQLPQYMYLLHTLLITICFSSLKFVLS